MRRKDRERDESFALRVFDEAPYCTLGLSGKNGHVYTVPLSMVRDGNSLYFHSAMEGRKCGIIKENSNVSVTAVSEFFIDSAAYTVRYKSAYAEACAIEVVDRDEKIIALKLLIERFAPDNTKINPEKYIDSLLDKMLVYRLDIKSITGKENPRI